VCDLGGWDAAILVSGRALADLSVALDQSVQPTLDASTPDLDFQGLAFNCTEQLLNLELFVPRVLYATSDPDFDPDGPDYDGADDDLERLHARLKEYRRLGLFGPSRRLTFVRDEWFDGVAVTPTIELAPDDPDHPADHPEITVRLTIGGKVLIADNFVDGATAAGSPDARDFTLKLDYALHVRDGHFSPLDVLDQLNLGLQSLPFMTVSPGLDCAVPVGRRLPPEPGRPIWAQDTGAVRASGGSTWRLTSAGSIRDGTATLFTGGPDDVILDADDNERWVVVDRFRESGDGNDGLQSLLQRVLVDVTCIGAGGEPVAVAESAKAYAALVFHRIVPGSLAVDGWLFNVAELAAINRSIMKLDGFWVGAWLDGSVGLACETLGIPGCPTTPDPQQVALLALLGRQAMDIGPLPADLTLPQAPRYVEDGDDAYVLSDVIVFNDAACRVFPPAGSDSGAIALGGRFIDLDPPAGRLGENFGNGQDLALGLAQDVVDRWLLPVIRPQIRQTLRDNVPGFDRGAFDDCEDCLTLTLEAGHIQVHVAGEGAEDLGFISLPFDFALDFPLAFLTRPAVLRLNTSADDPASDLNGRPVDALGFPLPAAMPCIGIDLDDGDFLSPLLNSNPICFLGYLDPRVPGAELDAVPRGPWTRVDGQGCPTCTLQSEICPDGPTIDPAFLWRNEDFAVPPFLSSVAIPGLHPGLEAALVPPARDEVEMDVDFPWWMNLIVGFLAGPFLGLSPSQTILATNALADLLAFRLVYDGLSRGVASQIPIQASLTLGWQCFLQHSDPTVPSNDALTIHDGSLCLRFRVLTRPLTWLGNTASAVCPGAPDGGG